MLRSYSPGSGGPSPGSPTPNGVIVDSKFVTGVIMGVLGTWAFHKWIKPMPTSAKS